MKPKFKLVRKDPEAAFLGCKICLPDAQALTIEIAAEFRREPDDVLVSYANENGMRYVLVSLREVREINCYQGACWIVDARDCLREKIEYDLIGATEDNIADLKLEDYDDVFRWSGPKQRRKFRLIQQTGN